MMLGTFGLRPKATLRARALGIAATLSQHFDFALTTTPWDHPVDRGKRWVEEGVPVLNTRFAHPLLFPLAVREMVGETTRHNAELIHLFKPKGFGDLAARQSARHLPVVVDMDDWEGDGGWNQLGGYGPLQRRLFDWQERTWPRKAAAITVASKELCRRAIDLGANTDAVFYVPNGLPRARFRAFAEACAEDAPEHIRSALVNHPVLLLYTRFVEFAPNLAAEIITGIRRRLPDAVLLVVGASASGHAEHELRGLLQQSGCGDAIHFAGWTEPHTIPALLRLGDAAIHPFEDNLVNRSKCSVKLLELMASGVPVVTNRVGENASMIDDDVSGFLVSPGNVDQMVRRAVDLLLDGSRARQIGAAARDRVANHYLWDLIAPTVEQAYCYALGVHSSTKR